MERTEEGVQIFIRQKLRCFLARCAHQMVVCFRAAVQLTSRWGIIKAAALCKVAKLRDPVAYEQQHNQNYPAPQPIAVVCGKAYYAPNPSDDVVVSPLSATTPGAVSPEINYIGSLVIYDWGPEIGDVEG